MELVTAPDNFSLQDMVKMFGSVDWDLVQIKVSMESILKTCQEIKELSAKFDLL